MFSANIVQNVGTAASSYVTNIPEGPATVTLSNLNNVKLFVGPGTSVSSTNGFALPATTPSFQLYFPPMSAPSSLWVIAASGTANTLGYVVTAPG